MTAVTSLTEQVARELHIHDDWRIKQIDPGQLVHILHVAVFKNGEHIHTRTHSDVKPQRVADIRDARILRIKDSGGANELDSQEVVIPLGALQPDAYRPAEYVLVYNHHVPSDPKVPSRNNFVWLYVSPAVNLGRLKEQYQEVFGS
jgi:hypothetical protein